MLWPNNYINLTLIPYSSITSPYNDCSNHLPVQSLVAMKNMWSALTGNETMRSLYGYRGKFINIEVKKQQKNPQKIIKLWLTLTKKYSHLISMSFSQVITKIGNNFPIYLSKNFNNSINNHLTFHKQKTLANLDLCFLF